MTQDAARRRIVATHTNKSCREQERSKRVNVEGGHTLRVRDNPLATRKSRFVAVACVRHLLVEGVEMYESLVCVSCVCVCVCVRGCAAKLVHKHICEVY